VQILWPRSRQTRQGTRPREPINYIDRGSLSIAAPLLKDELGLTPSQIGILLSSFFWTYAAFTLISGWLADHLDGFWPITATAWLKSNRGRFTLGLAASHNSASWLHSCLSSCAGARTPIERIRLGRSHRVHDRVPVQLCSGRWRPSPRSHILAHFAAL
jgi:hypothetical protein